MIAHLGAYIWLFCGLLGMVIYYFYDWKHFVSFRIVEMIITFIVGVIFGGITLVMSITYCITCEQIKRKRKHEEFIRQCMKNRGF